MAYREAERDIDNQIERLERLITKMESVGAQTLTDMPKAPSATTDRMADYVWKKEELEAEIRDAIHRQGEEKKSIEAILARLRSSDEKAVIRMRYFDRASWNEVLDMMFGGREDFLGKEDTYLRRVHKIHGSALQNMAKILSAADPNTAIPAK